MWKILVEMAKALLVSEQVEMGPCDRRWVLPLVVGTAAGLSPAAIAGSLRETSWRPRGSLLRSEPSGGTRPHLGCWDTTKGAEMSVPAEGRGSPRTGPGQQECVTGRGRHIGSVACPSALWLYSVLAWVPAHRRGDMVFLFPGVAFLSAPPTVGHRGVHGFMLHVVISAYFSKI